MAKPRIYIGLAHHPVYNKNMEIITTSITSLDIHDIARSARTYEVAQYFVIHPLESQQHLVQNILGFWHEGWGAEYNPDRREALSRVSLINTIDEAVAEITKLEGKAPITITTDARIYPNTITYTDLRNELHKGEQPYLLLFGTGWGLEEDTMKSATYILEPIYGPGDYNHLCVRGAVSIILDRLLGEPWWKPREI